MFGLLIILAAPVLLALPTLFAARSRNPWIGSTVFAVEACLAIGLGAFAFKDAAEFNARAKADHIACGMPLLGDFVIGFSAAVWGVGLIVAFLVGRGTRRPA